MKIVLVGLWVVLVALGSAYGVAIYLPKAQAAKAVTSTVLQYQKTRVINVPLIADGVVQGFMAMQFVFTIDGESLKALHVPPEVYLLDEAFRTIYTDKALDFHNLERYDLAKFTAHLIETTNAHLGTPLVKDILIENFSYISKDNKRSSPARAAYGLRPW